jgi:hypothetical protein
MATYDNLPVYRTAYELFRQCFGIALDMSRAYRFTLGEWVLDNMLEVFTNIYRANRVREKSQHINAARENVEKVRVLMRIAYDERQISQKKFIWASQQVESISKQLAAWEKSQSAAPAGSG